MNEEKENQDQMEQEFEDDDSSSEEDLNQAPKKLAFKKPERKLKMKVDLEKIEDLDYSDLPLPTSMLKLNKPPSSTLKLTKPPSSI